LKETGKKPKTTVQNNQRVRHSNFLLKAPPKVRQLMEEEPQARKKKKQAALPTGERGGDGGPQVAPEDDPQPEIRNSVHNNEESTKPESWATVPKIRAK